MATAALLIGLLILMQGMVGLVAPDLFVSFVRTLQTSPLIYLAAAIRLAVGVVFIGAAATSRLPKVLAGFGVLIVIGGLLTPFIGARIAAVVLGWWSEGPEIVRIWAGASLAMGIFVVYAVAPSRRAP